MSLSPSSKNSLPLLPILLLVIAMISIQSGASLAKAYSHWSVHKVLPRCGSASVHLFCLLFLNLGGCGLLQAAVYPY